MTNLEDAMGRSIPRKTLWERLCKRHSSGKMGVGGMIAVLVLAGEGALLGQATSRGDPSGQSPREESARSSSANTLKEACCSAGVCAETNSVDACLAPVEVPEAGASPAVRADAALPSLGRLSADARLPSDASADPNYAVVWMSSHPRVQGVYFGTAERAELTKNQAGVAWTACTVRVGRVLRGEARLQGQSLIMWSLNIEGGPRCDIGESGVFFDWRFADEIRVSAGDARFSGTTSSSTADATSRLVARALQAASTEAAQ